MNGAKSAKSKGSRRKKSQYSGGLVWEPQKGFYDRYVLQIYFNPLYPSIIQEFKICFTTLPLSRRDKIAATDIISTPNEGASISTPMTKGRAATLRLPSRSVHEGVLPRVLRRLVEQRRQLKKELKKERQRAGKESSCATAGHLSARYPAYCKISEWVPWL